MRAPGVESRVCTRCIMEVRLGNRIWGERKEFRKEELGGKKIKGKEKSHLPLGKSGTADKKCPP